MWFTFRAAILCGLFEEVRGYGAQHIGHTFTAVFDPDPVSATGFIVGFAEPLKRPQNF